MDKTPMEVFRNSVAFQINFILYSGLEVEKAIDHICDRAEKLIEAAQLAENAKSAATGEEKL